MNPWARSLKKCSRLLLPSYLSSRYYTAKSPFPPELEDIMPAGPAILLLKAPGGNWSFWCWCTSMFVNARTSSLYELHTWQCTRSHRSAYAFLEGIWIRKYDGCQPGWQCEGEVEMREEAGAWREPLLLLLLLLLLLAVGSLFEEGEVQPRSSVMKNVFHEITHYSWKFSSSLCNRIYSPSPVLRNCSIYCILWITNMTKHTGCGPQTLSSLYFPAYQVVS